jgi:hypothetical protein
MFAVVQQLIEKSAYQQWADGTTNRIGVNIIGGRVEGCVSL